MTGSRKPPLDLTKWFGTNYHHLVPELIPDIAFHADSSKACNELAESAALGIPTTEVLLGPLTLLLRSGSTEGGFDTLSLLGRLVTSCLVSVSFSR